MPFKRVEDGGWLLISHKTSVVQDGGGGKSRNGCENFVKAVGF